MIRPPFLKQGSVIGITCPSGYVSQERVAYAIKTIERWGFRLKLGKTIGTEHYYFSGTDEQRLSDLQSMMNDEEVDAILMGRGGYGMSRIIDTWHHIINTRVQTTWLENLQVVWLDSPTG